MKKLLILAVAPLVALSLAGCTHREAFADAKREIDSQDDLIRTLRKRNEELIARQSALDADLKAARAEADALRAGRKTMDEDFESMRERLASFEEKFGRWDQEVGGIRMKAHREGVALEVAETLLFAPGKAALSDRGKSVLKDVASRIREKHQGNVRIEGHTDDKPVVIYAKEFPLGNLQLSGRRALVVADFLIKEGGLNPDRVSYAGYGEHRPVVANDSNDSRARNRRVEIVLLSAK